MAVVMKLEKLKSVFAVLVLTAIHSAVVGLAHQPLERRGTTLKELAKEAADGRAIVEKNPLETPQLRDLHDLARFSDEIVIAVPRSNICRLSADGADITTDFEVEVQAVLAGNLRPGRKVSVSLPGGLVVFEDHTSAEVRAPWFIKMEEGKTYLLFLERLLSGRGYVAVGGPQGSFRIDSAAGVVKTQSGRFEDPVWAYDDMPLDEFYALLNWAIQDRRVVKGPVSPD